LLPAFPDGAYLILLDTTQSTQALAPLIAQAVGLELSAERTGLSAIPSASKESMLGQLTGYLRDKKMLLVLDGFEQALPETEVASQVLRMAPEVKLLVTSRARLNLEAEQILLLEGLSFPAQVAEADPAEYSAVQLFIEAARRSAPDFALTELNQQALTEICRLTEGLPLGILLAASWIGTLEPAQIVQEIQRSLDILNADWQDLPTRQRSLRATFDHSLRLLPEAEQTIFLCLAVFHTPFTAERAVQAAGASLGHLRSLINQSLLMHASTEGERSSSRYRLHDLLRQYAQERLAADPEAYQQAHGQHAQAYLQALAAWEPRLKSRQQPAALAAINLEYADILSAWNWAVSHNQVEQMQAAIEPLSYYQTLRGYFHENAVLCQEAMEALESLPLSPATLRLWLHTGAWLVKDLIQLSQHKRAREVICKLEERLARWEGSRAELTRTLGWFYLAKADAYLVARRLTEGLEAALLGLELMRQGKDPWDMSYALHFVGILQSQEMNVRQVIQFALQALEIQVKVGDPTLRARILQSLGYYYMLSGNHQAGLATVKEQQANLRINDYPYHRALSNSEMGWAMFYAGQFEQAREYFQQIHGTLGHARLRKSKGLESLHGDRQ
jgi:predicted ATPase